MDLNWFQLGPIPPNVILGSYNLSLVSLSYIIAVLASYVALDLVGRLRAEVYSQAKVYWLLGGAFAMGAGIWSMHFIGMLAFIMPMQMGYSLLWTSFSLLVAILASGFALFILRKDQPISYFILSGILIGFGIATMHYMGMKAMSAHVNIHYLPSLFFLSIAIAILASEAALWLALRLNRVGNNKQFYLKILSAMIMGIAICGMHYTGMAAAVFTPLSHSMVVGEIIRPDLLAFYIAGITGLIISLALTVSTYYKRMINAVQNEKQFLNAMLDNLEDGIIACDSEGKITVFNDVLQKGNSNSMKGRYIKELAEFYRLYLPNNERELTKNELPLVRALNGERIHSLELILQIMDGTLRDVVIDGQPIINASGNKLGAVIAIHDITEIKKTEKIKSEFVSVVSHELRTPLTSIRGSLALLLGGAVGEFPEKAAKLLDIANKNCERLLLLINDILDMEKIQAGKMKFDLKVCDVKSLIQEAILTNKMYADKFDVNIKVESVNEDVNIYVDPDRLLQVLANLISNAAKFSHQGDDIKIKMEIKKNYICISVCDQGSGIPIEFQSRIFQKFSQADSSDTRGKGGTGLGLSISKAIIEKMGGTLNFISHPNQETIFYFNLPIYSYGKQKPPVPNTFPDTKKLLICEDDKDQANYISSLLLGAKINADIAHTYARAQKLLSENQYDGILLDLILPDKDGITIIRELRKNDKTKNTPIIVLSVMTEDGQELLKGDALLVLDWLDKPINKNKLLAAIERIKVHSDNLPHILHVEDDLDTQHIISSLLENSAIVTTSINIKETIYALGHDTFDLVILDLLLPDGNGSDLLPIFAKYQLPIIVYSAFELDKEFSKYVTQALIKSKISNEDLLSTIKKLLEEPIKDTKYVD